jgi:hypothetical protein
VFTGDGAPVSFAADEDAVVINRGTVEKLASLDAIIAYFDAADVRVPPLVVEGTRARRLQLKSAIQHPSKVRVSVPHKCMLDRVRTGRQKRARPAP